MAWGVLGHRIVGEIAEGYLTTNARKKVREILGTESIAMSSNWADFIKSDNSYRYLNAWHYADMDSGLTFSQVKEYFQKDTAVDAYTKITFIVKELKKRNLPQDKKLFYLRLLIHFVGDVHQPLHVGRKSDMGGNNIKVSWFREQTNLHSIWDSHLIEFQKLSYTEYTKAINHTSSLQRRKWQSQPMMQWFYESYQISEQLHTGVTEPEMRLSYEYNFRHIDTLNERLLKGGVRLAALLNEIFK
jgi:hypothetical protein